MSGAQQQLTLAFGAWPSPLGPAELASSRFLTSPVWRDGGRPAWLESRTSDGQTVLTGADRDGGVVSLWQHPVESRLLGYGGGEVVPCAGGLLVVSAADQQWHLVGDGVAMPVTPDGLGHRYGDGAISGDGRVLYCVRERDRDDVDPEHDVVAIDLGKPGPQIPQRLVAGSDFVTAPRPRPDGALLAWLGWDHPNMPWDAATLFVGSLSDGTVRDVRHVAGGDGCSCQQPMWHPDGTLVFLCDAHGWWTPYRWDPATGITTALCTVDAEFAEPPWQCGTSTMGVLTGGEILVATTSMARTSLGLVPPGHPCDEPPHELSTPVTYLPGDQLRVHGDSALLVAATLDRPAAVVRLDLQRAGDGRVASWSWHEIRSARDAALDPALVAASRVLRVDVGAGTDARPAKRATIDAVLHHPRNPAAVGPPGALPPLLLDIHGGPTSRVPLAHSAGTAYWTTRGFAVVYPNYAGSSGAGRAVRDRLQGAWGRVDVSDCLAAAAAVTQSGAADAGAIFARGVSAGGYTALCAARTGAFRGVVSWSGVTDPARLGAVTHKFERRYVEQLLGPRGAPHPVEAWPAPPCPVLLLHGLDDDIVPVEQAMALRDALRSCGGRVALAVFPGERHGFVSPSAVARGMALEAAFYAELLGLDGAGLPAVPWVVDTAEPTVVRL